MQHLRHVPQVRCAEAPGSGGRVKIRVATPNDAAGIARVHVESWLTTYPGLVPAEMLSPGRQDVAQRTTKWRKMLENPTDDEFTLVAVADDGEIVGFAGGSRERTGDPTYTAELPAIYLLRRYQGQGLGKRLMQAVASGLQQRGHKAMLLWVLATNPSRAFYEWLGGSVVRERQHDFAGTLLGEVAYGWPDLSVLSGRPLRK